MSEPVPPIFNLVEGDSILLISVPHAGVYMPPELRARLTPAGQAAVDTDWFVDRLYGFAAEAQATMLVATHSRNLVDLNRSPSGGKLYPGQAETGVCPTETFAGAPLYAGPSPDTDEIAERVRRWWQPYHDALAGQIERIRLRHGRVHLLDGHSIRGTIPRLFAGVLPDLNFGTNGGASADPAVVAGAMAATADSGFSQVLDGRFRGGYITRYYARPADGVHAVQLELAQSCYMDESVDPHWNAASAGPLIAALRSLVRELLGA